MTSHRCDWCGAADSRWIKHVDQGPLDYLHRKIVGMPGPTSKAYRACDVCLPKMNLCFPSDPDKEAIAAMREELEAL